MKTFFRIANLQCAVSVVYGRLRLASFVGLSFSSQKIGVSRFCGNRPVYANDEVSLYAFPPHPWGHADGWGGAE